MSVNEIVAQAYLYVERGWAVIPTKPGGKAPIGMNWQNSGRRMRAEIDATWAANPDAGVGILTGRPSGFWVLDVDPVNGGDKQLAGLIQAYGRLPETYTVATPSGGTHYYFLMPDDFEPTNAPGRLPEGIDVRGTGGQVLAPPTMRGGRRYSVLTDLPLARCAQWVLELIVPVEHEPRAAVDESVWTAAGPGAGGMLDRGHAYAMAAVQALLGDLTLATAGSRNREAYRVSVRLVELVNSPWSGLDAESVLSWYLQAAAACGLDQDLPRGQPERAWASALRAKAGAGVGLPEAEFYGSVLPFEALGVSAAGFSSPGTATSSATTPTTGMGGLTFVDPATTDEASSAPAAQVQQQPVDAVAAARELRIQEEMSRIWFREEAQRRLKALSARPRNWAAEILDEDGLASVVPPVPLVADWLFTDSLARINGPSGHGKSFVALEMAACVSTGRGWHRRAVHRGLVVYVAAEGASGVRQRLEAWKLRHEVERHGLLVLPSPVQVTEAEWDGFVEHMRALRPAMVVLDTQARVTVGVDENSATEMGEFVDGLERLRAATGACVLVVHHRGLKGTEGRGSTAVKGAVTTEMDVSRTGTKVLISCRKQKDAPEAESIQTQLVMIDPNDPAKSAVLVAAGDSYSSSEGLPVFVNPSLQDVAKMRLLALISVLRDQFGMGNGGTRAEIKVAFQAHPDIQGLSPDVQRRAWNRSWGRLEDLGRIARNPLAERFKFAEIDDLDDCAENPDNYSEFGWPIAKRSEPTT